MTDTTFDLEMSLPIYKALDDENVSISGTAVSQRRSSRSSRLDCRKSDGVADNESQMGLQIATVRWGGE